MELKTCMNGHHYDPSISPECPECAKLRGETVPLNEGPAYGGFVGADDYGKTEPLHRPTEPVNYNQGGHWAEVDKYSNIPFESEAYSPTMPVSYRPVEKKNTGIHAEAMGNIRPVVGWLVCVDGPSKGTDFKLHSEYNYIGRTAGMDVCIPGDSTISRENHAIVAYDTLAHEFYFGPSSGGSIVRVNGKAVLGSVVLNAYDRIVIGKSQFLFIPFCGEKFEWE